MEGIYEWVQLDVDYRSCDLEYSEAVSCPGPGVKFVQFSVLR